MTDDDLMRRAIALAREAIDAGQMPVAAVLARDGEIVVEAHNTVWRDTDPSAHAEMNCLCRGALLRKTVDLSGTTIDATLEPCPMCLGAIHRAKVGRANFGVGIADSVTVDFFERAVPAATLAQMGGEPGRHRGRAAPRRVRGAARRVEAGRNESSLLNGPLANPRFPAPAGECPLRRSAASREWLRSGRRHTPPLCGGARKDSLDG